MEHIFSKTTLETDYHEYAFCTRCGESVCIYDPPTECESNQLSIFDDLLDSQ